MDVTDQSPPENSAPRSGEDAALSFAFLEAMLANTLAGVALLDRDLCYRHVNDRLAALNGRSVEAHLGRTVAEVVAAEQWAERRPLLERALAGEEIRDQPLSGLGPPHPDGPGRVLTSYLPVRAGGQVVGVAAFVRDTTARARTEEALQESLALLDTLLDTAPVGFAFFDNALRYRRVNAALAEMNGVPAEALLGHTLQEVLRRPDPARVEGLRHVQKTGEPQVGVEVTAETPAAPGVARTWLASYYPVSADGRRLGVGAVVVEITERKQAERALRAAEARQRGFLRDVLASVTEGRLRLCDSPAHLPAPLPPAGGTVFLSLEGGLRELRQYAREAAQRRGFPDERWQDLVTAASEAGMNAIVHGGGHGTAQVCADGDGTVQVWVKDFGTGIDMENLPKATLARGWSTKASLGHGLVMMLQTADRLWLLTGPTGTVIVLEQDRAVPPPAFLADRDILGPL